MNTVLVFCHPDPDSLSAALYAAAMDAIKQRGDLLRCFDLYAEQFQPILTIDERKAYLTDPKSIITTVQAHVDALRWAEHLVFIFPIWFYGPPAMLKGWLERVWLPGVAFLPPPQKGKAAIPGLQHIQRMTVITHGGAPWWWLKLIGDPAKRLFTRGLRALMAKRCRTTWLQLHNMNNVSRAECEAFIQRVRKNLEDF